MNEKKRRVLMWATRLAVGLVALVVAGVLFQVLVATAPQVTPDDGGRTPPRAPVLVAQRVPVQRQWQGYGTAEAMDSADVPARVTATVVDIPPSILPGSRVTAGQTLVQLDGSDFERQVEITEQLIEELQAQLRLLEVESQRLDEQLALESEDLKLAKDELERVRRIYASGATNQQDMDRIRRNTIAVERQVVATTEAISRLQPRQMQIEAQLAGQRAALKLARQNLDRATITSPIDGVLQSVDVELGEELRPGVRVARVVNLTMIETPLRLPALARRDLAVGDGATIFTTMGQTRQFDATIARIAPVDDPSTRTVTVYLVVEQPDAAKRFGAPDGPVLLIPGAFVSGTVVSDRSVERWIVPRRAVRSGRVRTVRDGVIVSESVTVDFVIEGEYPSFGLPDTQWAVLAEDTPLKAGDLLLVNAATALLDGDAVTPALPEQVEGAVGVSGEGISLIGAAPSEADVTGDSLRTRPGTGAQP